MISYDSAASLMYEILKKKDALDRMSVRLNNGHKVFKDVFLEKPKLKPAELGLLRAVSWFYVLYNETGKINVQFLNERIAAYNLEVTPRLCEHLLLTNRLRTYFQHNLDPSKPRDRDIQDCCEGWFTEHCSTSEPEGDKQWLSCLFGFLEEVVEFFDALLKCIREIERDESREQILREWEFQRNRFHPPHEFDSLIAQVATDMGRESLDIVRFRKRFYEKWIKELDILQGDYNFQIEGRKLIERTLLSEDLTILPLTGSDILEVFENVKPGPKVGELLRKAKTLYEREPGTKEQLLSRLQEFVDR